MDLSNGIIFGIITMLSWGVADFLAAASLKKTSIYKIFIWSQIIGLLFFVIVFLLFFKLPKLSTYAIELILIGGLLSVVSYLAFYKALQVGKVSIISPIAASWVIITVVLALVFLKEGLTLLHGLGVFLVVLGIIITSFKLHDLLALKFANLVSGVKYAIVALLGMGVFFYLIGIMVNVDDLGWFFPIFFIKITAIFYFLLYVGFKRENISFPKNVTMLVIVIGVLEVIAFFAYSFGVSFHYTVIVAPVSATFPVVTIFLAWIFFGEKLEFNQKTGVILVLLGLILLSI